MNINCFIINLKRCPEKRKRMIKRMESFPEINYEFYDAIDGQELTPESMDQNNYKILQEWTDPFNNRKTTKGEVGCTLSHYNVYKQALERSNDITLILEDDADFSDEFIDELKNTINHLNGVDWEMCYLGRKKVNTNDEEERINDVLLYPSYSYWTIGYLITKSFCKNVIQSNLLQNIIVIDEYLSLVGDCSEYKKYRKYYDNTIKMVSVDCNIIFPEKDAFKNSDTEISSYLPNNRSELLVLTVATDENEPLKRFIHSCNNYGLRYKVLGLDYEWTGGNMSKGPGGGMKLNLLKKELMDYNQDDIILFSDSYDVIFLSGGEEIMEKYLNFKADVIFAGEKTCWPDRSMEKIFNDDGPYKYINSGGFIGKVDIIRSIIDVDFDDTYDDQYLIHSRYEQFRSNIKIDTKCEIFQTSSNNIDEIDIQYQTNRLTNQLYQTKPCHYHGNGSHNVKVIHNNYCNYLLKQWNPLYQYRIYRQDIRDKIIYLFIYCDGEGYDLSLFFEGLELIDYPKENIQLTIYSKVDIDYRLSDKYRNIDINRIDNDEHIIRDNSLREFTNSGCEYYLNIDPICIISNQRIIYDLLSYDKDIVCPLLRLGDNNWTNYWGDIDGNGWYRQSFNYFDIIEYRHKGCWNVPYINNLYLIKSSIVDQLYGYYSLNYSVNRGCDMSFCENCRHNNIFLYLCNEQRYGELYDTSINIVSTDDNIKEKILEVDEGNYWSGNNIMVIDDILEKDVINQLRGFALTTDFNTSNNYYGGYQDYGFDSSNYPITELKDVMEYLTDTYCDILRDLEFDRGWFFIYDNECPGVTPHSDPASVNINIWLTPDDSVKDKSKNGLIIWDKKRPSDWTYREYNKDVEKIKEYLTESKATKQIVEYKCNRGMIFDSTYFHETNGVSMKDGYWNKRINLVYMFKPKEGGIKNEITIFDYYRDERRYLEKYFHPDFVQSINKLDLLPIDEPISDVLQFPIVNDIFCKELIQVCEEYGKWSGAVNEDSRIGYENVPSNDIHFTEIKMNKLWEDIIIKYIAPIVSYHWGSFKTNDLNIGFVVKYQHNQFYKLGPHHDSSAYTINISLNNEYEGGEVRFIKKDQKIKNKKGYALIHPGRITHYHEGLPVTKGDKYVCVSFVN